MQSFTFSHVNLTNCSVKFKVCEEEVGTFYILLFVNNSQGGYRDLANDQVKRV